MGTQGLQGHLDSSGRSVEGPLEKGSYNPQGPDTPWLKPFRKPHHVKDPLETCISWWPRASHLKVFPPFTLRGSMFEAACNSVRRTRGVLQGPQQLQMSQTGIPNIAIELQYHLPQIMYLERIFVVIKGYISGPLHVFRSLNPSQVVACESRWPPGRYHLFWML